MKEIMDFEKCKKEYLRTVQPDKNKILSIIKLATVRLRAIKQIKKDKETVTVIIEGYYEIIKELLIALLLKSGLKSDNHECLVSFFKDKYPDYEYEALTIHELKNIRNKINYEGIFVDPSYLAHNEREFNHIIDILKEHLNF